MAKKKKKEIKYDVKSMDYILFGKRGGRRWWNFVASLDFPECFSQQKKNNVF